MKGIAWGGISLVGKPGTEGLPQKLEALAENWWNSHLCSSAERQPNSCNIVLLALLEYWFLVGGEWVLFSDKATPEVSLGPQPRGS